MTASQYDLVVIGAGAGGLTAAKFAAKIGARVALIERDRLGGDCTWTGCIPSKSLIRVAKVAHDARVGARFGVTVGALAVDMHRVRAYVQGVVRDVYDAEPAEALERQGIDVLFGGATFEDAHRVRIGD
ncbi:MAG: FAD-dependent oxidoreductase, partial [Vicinamibacterales bacterium]